MYTEELKDKWHNGCHFISNDSERNAYTHMEWQNKYSKVLTVGEVGESCMGIVHTLLSGYQKVLSFFFLNVCSFLPSNGGH